MHILLSQSSKYIFWQARIFKNSAAFSNKYMSLVQRFISWDLCFCRPVIKLLVHDRACSHNAFLITSPCPPFDTQAPVSRVTLSVTLGVTPQSWPCIVTATQHNIRHTANNNYSPMISGNYCQGKNSGSLKQSECEFVYWCMVKTGSIFDFLFQRLV